MDSLLNYILELAAASRKCGRFDEAADLYLRAVEQSGGCEPAYLHLANECRALACGLSFPGMSHRP
jgi:hypothetical protein